MTTEKIRVKASSVISSVHETSATPARCRLSGCSDIRPECTIRARDDLADPGSSSRVRRRIGDLVGRAAAGDVRVEPAVSADTGLPAVVRHLPRRQPSVSPASGTIVFSVGIADAGLRAVHGHLRGRGDCCARIAIRRSAEAFPLHRRPDATHPLDRSRRPRRSATSGRPATRPRTGFARCPACRSALSSPGSCGPRPPERPRG